MTIVCYIEGNVTYPTLRSEIKIQRFNPFLKGQDARTLDVEFPLNILENRRVFGALHRHGTSKRFHAFTDVRLLADNYPVIQGTGRISEITERSVKLQILAGANSMKYRAEFEKKFIDRLTNYPAMDAKYAKNPTLKSSYSDLIDVTSEIAQKSYIGDITKGVFMPIYDNNNSIVANEIVSDMTGYTVDKGVKRLLLVHRAVQPNFMMVVEKAIEAMGYTIAENIYNVSPWNRMVIANARQTNVIANALPHWTVATLLEEFRKLFNATFLFDDQKMQVRIVRTDTLSQHEIQSYEVAEEFTATYDEDGTEYLAASNIRYNLPGLCDLEEIPQEVFRNFDYQEFNSHTGQGADLENWNDLRQYFESLDDKGKLTTLLACPIGMYYGKEDDSTEQHLIVLSPAPPFTGLMRDVDSDSFVDLNIAPVSMGYWGLRFRDIFNLGVTGAYWVENKLGKCDIYLPCIECDWPSADDTTEDEDVRDYVSIQDVIEAGESATAETTEEQTSMLVMWPTNRVESFETGSGSQHVQLDVPLSSTDARIVRGTEMGSMALTHAKTVSNIGQFHQAVVAINAGKKLDNNNEVCIHFLCDGMPDATKIFNFEGKLYLASHIDTKVTEKGIDRLKEGYFYEILT